MRNPIFGTMLATALAGAMFAQAPAAKKAAPAAPKAATAAPKADPKPAASSTAATTTAAAGDPVIITVGDEKITKSQYEALLAALPEQARAGATGPSKRQFAEQYADMVSLAREARRRGMDKTPAFKAKTELQTENLLASDLYQSFKPSDNDVKAYYDQHKTEFDQVKASHILIRFKGSPVPVKKDQKDLTDDEALAKVKEIRAKLAGGADFAEVAKAESDDTGTGENGGALGFFGKGQMVPAFEQAAFALPVGTLSEPVKTQFGYHLIKVEERKSKTFDEVKAQIEGKLKPEIAKKAIEEIKKGNPVTVSDEYFGKPMTVSMQQQQPQQ